jgi:hypothetical protein
VSEEQQTQEYTPVPVEDQAREMGWKPLDDYQGDRSKWVNAEIFVARAPLFEKIEADKRAHKRETDELRTAVRDLAEHNKTVAESAYRRAINDLKLQKKEALAEGDTIKALEIADKITEFQENKPVPVVQNVPQPQGPPPEIFQRWTKENDWYEKDSSLREEADTLGFALAAKGLQPEEILNQVKDKIKRMYPEKFERVKAPDGGEAPRGGQTRTNGSFTLSADEERIMNRFIKTSGGTLTREAYIKDLKAIKGLS